MAEMTEKIVALEVGDEIMVLVGGHAVMTEIDEHGVQRFQENSVINHMLRMGMIDLTRLWTDFYRGDFDRDGFINLYISLGYSLSGFAEVWGSGSAYHDNTGDYVEIVNPVWLDEKEMRET